MKEILDAAKRIRAFIDKHKEDAEVKTICADLLDLYAAFAEEDEKRFSQITSVDPDVLKAVKLSQKLDTLRRQREKAKTLLQFCTDALRLALAVRGFKA